MPMLGCVAFGGVQLDGALLQSLALPLELRGAAELLQRDGAHFSMGHPVHGEHLIGAGIPLGMHILARAGMADPWCPVSRGWMMSVPSGSIGVSVKNQGMNV